jgi:protein involved in plasmid replication-relaxation
MSEPIRRQLRHRRRKGVRVQLAERDETVLHALARFRLARTSDLVRYAFAGVRADTAAARLRRLFDAKYLAVLPPRQGFENVYRLGPAGSRYLAGQGAQVGRVPRGGVDHHLAIVQTWVALTAVEGIGLERCLPDWELREQFTAYELTAIPDLFALIRVGASVYPIAVEVDCGTESLAVLGRKLETYRSLWGRPPGLFGYEQFGIAAVSFSPVRRPALVAALKKAWVVPHVLWECRERARSALGRLFEELRPPLSASPYRKGSEKAW